ncbi:MAG: hypothetical protein ACO3JG_01995 [Luteolibacter sp.]
MRLFLFCMGLWVSAILPLTAQSGAEGDRRPGAGRTAWFACLAKPAGLENPVKLLAGEKVSMLELPEFMASEGVKIPADGVLRIVREVPDRENQGKLKHVILAEAKIPETVQEALVILSPIAKPEGALLFQSKVQDLADFKGGDRLFINLSDSNIRVKLGKTLVAVESRHASIFKAPPMAKPTNMPVMYEFFHPERKEWKILGASTVVLRPTRREICVFNNGSRIGNIEKHKILFPVM